MSAPDPRVGSLLDGRLRLEERVATGTLGPVYLAREVSSERAALVQVLETGAREVERLARDLITATQPLAGIEGLLLWKELVVTPEGERYLVADAPGGPSLETVFARGESLPAARVQELLGDLLRILGEVRDHPRGGGLLHLALSPASVFLAGDGVQLIDFGVGALALGLTYGQHQASAGVAFGTGPLPEYAAPEVCSRLATGSSRPRLDDRADLFSVGALGYRMLAGRSPQAEEEAPDPRAAWTRQHLLQLASTPCLSMAASGARVPAALARFVDRCLSFDRVQRFADLAEAHAALSAKRIAGGARRPSGLALLAVLVLGILGAGTFWMLRRQRQAAPLQALAVSGSGVRQGERFVLGLPERATLEVVLDGPVLEEGTPLEARAVFAGGVESGPWEVRRLAPDRLSLRAPADTRSGAARVRVSAGGRALAPLEVMLLGADAIAGGRLAIEGWDGELPVDPAGVLLTAEVDLGQGVESSSIARVELAALDAGGARLGPVAFEPRADARSSFELPLDRLAWTEGRARLEVSVTDVLGRSRELEPLELDLVPDALEFRSVGLDGGFRSGDGTLLFVRDSTPSVHVELSRPGRVVWHTEVEGVIAPESEVTEWPEGLGHLQLTGLIDPSSGSDHEGVLVVTAREAEPVQRRGLGTRGEVEARFDYRVILRQLRVDPVLALEPPGGAREELAAGTRRFVGGAAGTLVLDPLDELPARAYVLHDHLAGSGGPRVLLEGPVDLVGGARQELPIELDEEGLHGISVDLFAVDPATGEEMERPRAGFDWSVVIDRTPPAVSLGAAFEAGAVLRSPAEVRGLAASVSDVPAAGMGERPAWLDWRLTAGESELAQGALEFSGVRELPLALGPEVRLDDGSYTLHAQARDEAGNLSAPRALSFELAATGPALAFRWPEDAPMTTAWKRGEEGWELSVEARDANGVRPWLDCTVEVVPEQGLPSPAPLEQRLEPVPGDPERFTGTLLFTSDWSERTARVRVGAEDRHGNRSSDLEATRPLADVVERRFPRLVVAPVDAGGPPVCEMRLVLGNGGASEPYVFQGRGDALENARFEADRIDLRFGAGARSWELACEPGSIPDFYLDRDEVSVREYLAFVLAPGGYARALHWPEGERPDRNRRDALSVRLEAELAAGGGDLPVTAVTWPEAFAYARWVGKRLPSLVEHEYAVRGGLDYRSWSGSWIPSGTLADAVRHDPAAQGELGPRARGDVGDVTPEGIRELCGNVAEWTGSPAPPDLRDDREWALGDPARVLEFGANAAQARDVYVAGASFRSLGADFSKLAVQQRSAQSPTLGFRCALSRTEAQARARSAPTGDFRFELAGE